MIRALRGATTIEKDTREEVFSATAEMMRELIISNNIDTRDICAVIFTVTNDIHSAFPAAAVRKLGITDVPLLDMAAPEIDNALKMCIRVMIAVNIEKDNSQLVHVYLNGAKALRPDLANNNTVSVAIDGPAGAGKSSVAKMAAKELGYVYIDTGAMYRAAALYMLNNGIDPSKDVIEAAAAMDKVNIVIEAGGRILLNGEDVSTLIRTSEVSAGASAVAKIEKVREKLVKLQQQMAQNADVIMDGRDIGTVVLPDAQLKLFMTASVEERAKRRHNEMREKGVDCDLEEIKADIAARDKNDSERKISPLKKADDALLFDTSALSFEESVEKLIGLIKEKIGV